MVKVWILTLMSLTEGKKSNLFIVFWRIVYTKVVFSKDDGPISKYDDDSNKMMITTILLISSDYHQLEQHIM